MRRRESFHETEFSSNNNTNFKQKTNTFTFVDKSKALKYANTVNTKPIIPANDEGDFYFSRILESFNPEMSQEEKEIFVHNVLTQTEGQELQLSCRSIPSHCIELVLDESNDSNVVVGFMGAFAKNFETACGNCFASHVTETLLYHGLKIMKTWSSDINASDELREKANNIISIISWVYNLAEFCLQNLQTCMEDAYGCHVLKTVIQVLGGYFTPKLSHRSHKKLKERKKNNDQGYRDDKCDLKVQEDIELTSVPKFFATILKDIAKSFIKLENVIDYAIHAETATVIEGLLFVLKKRLPKCCRKVIAILSSKLFDAKTKNGVAKILLHKNCSYVGEKIFSCAEKNQQRELWQGQVEPFLEILIKHTVGNYVLQRLIEIVDDKQQFEYMCESLFQHFNVIFDSRHFGLWNSIAKTCNKLRVQQAHYMMSLVQCLKPEDKPAELIKLLLSLKQQDRFANKDDSSKRLLVITLHGSLIVQNVLNFQKPFKVVSSILQMKSEELSYLACHIQGCYVLLSFFGSVTVGEKNKDNLLNIMKPILNNLACDKSGNLTLSRLWMLMTLKQKKLIAEELLKDSSLLQQNPYGFGISKKFRLFHYKSRREEWESEQHTLMKKRKYSSSE